jgi:CMP-N-acetylneuraminic acid synthetase
MVTLGVIPARGGSKGIPRKNLAPLGGEPLLAWTCRAAAAAARLTRVVVSTDDPEIAETAVRYGVEAPFVRPAELSRDDTPSLPVIQHALEATARDGFTPDTVVILQPTSPFRRAEHIDAAVAELAATGADSVVTVVAVPHAFNPVSVLVMDDRGRVRPYLPATAGPIVRRQDKPRVFARNGAAVYAIRADVVRAGSLFGEDCRGLEMAPLDSIDIDTPEDLELAEALVRFRGAGR